MGDCKYRCKRVDYTLEKRQRKRKKEAVLEAGHLVLDKIVTSLQNPQRERITRELGMHPFPHHAFLKAFSAKYAQR